MMKRVAVLCFGLLITMGFTASQLHASVFDVKKYGAVGDGKALDSPAINKAIDAARMLERRKTVIPLAIADGQQAIKVVRAHASEWGIAKDHIVFLGFSAGGLLAAGVALQHDADSRPNFSALLYPGTPDDLATPADIPPLFLVQADDDKTVTPLEHSIALYQAWKKAGVSAEMHIYSRGGHGFGMHKKGLPVDTWPDRLHDWLDLQGLLKPAR